MDTVDSFKDYGKVDEAENREFQRRTRRRLLLISVSALLLLIIFIGVVIVVVANKRGGNDNKSSPPFTTTSIKAMCGVTQYPDSCFSSISSMKGPNLTTDPEELLKLSLRVASDAVAKVSSLYKTFTIPTDDKRLELAFKDCKELFDDAVERLNDSIASSSSKDASGKLLTESKIDDLKSWLSAATTNMETCLNGFEGTTGDFRTKMQSMMTNSTQFTSNSLAIVSGILGILQKLDFSSHRKLLTTNSQGDLPSWILPSHRRALRRADLKPNVTVAKDGTGRFLTITEAVRLIPKKNLYPFVIYVKAGVYKENVMIDESKWNVVFYGDGMYKTIVTGSLNFVDGTPTFSTATFAAVGKGFMARDMGFRNTAGPIKHQAVAFRSGSDRSVFYRCSFEAYQDTLYAHSLRQFYGKCHISGTVDFIFGNAAAVFQKCIIRPRQPLADQKNVITAQLKNDKNENTGISIQGCTIKPYDGKVTAQTYLGRPLKKYSTTIFMQSEIGAVVHPAGWLSSQSGVVPPGTINYAEFRNTGPGSAIAGRVKWAGYRPTISAEEAAKFTVNSFLGGSKWLASKGVAYQPAL